MRKIFLFSLLFLLLSSCSINYDKPRNVEKCPAGPYKMHVWEWKLGVYSPYQRCIYCGRQKRQDKNGIMEYTSIKTGDWVSYPTN